MDGRRLLALLNAALLLADVVVAQDAARAQARTKRTPLDDIVDFGDDFGHNNTGMANVQNLTTAETAEAPEDDTGYGPVDQRRIEGIKDLLSHLNFIDLQLSQLNDSDADSFASLLSDLDATVVNKTFQGFLSGLDTRTQLEIDTASQFFADSKCYFPLNGKADENNDTWMFYLAKRAQAYFVSKRTTKLDGPAAAAAAAGEVAMANGTAPPRPGGAAGIGAMTDEVPWSVFPIICTNETFVIPPWLGAFEWMNDLISSVTTPVYTRTMGKLPDTIGNLHKLNTLSLHGGITGVIPESIGNLKDLTSLLLQNNELIGPIPETIGSCSNLMKIWLYDNQLTGSVPDSLADLENLQEFLVQDNQLTGALTPAVEGVQMELDRNFDIQGNPMWAEVSATTTVVRDPLSGWEIALIVVAVGLSAATFAASLVWAIRRSKQSRHNLAPGSNRSSDRSLALSEFESSNEAAALFCINRKDLKLVKLVGRGTYGSVFEAKWNDTPVAVKILNVSNEIGSREETRRYIQTFEKEVEYLSQVDHENIVKLFGYSLVSPHVYIVQELMEQNLSQVTRAKNYKPRDVTIIRIVKEIAMGLAYLHPRIVHCDLKPQNILLSKAGLAKIADFGISKRKQGTFIQCESPPFPLLPLLSLSPSLSLPLSHFLSD